MSNKPYPTPHINASPEDFAKTVLMPGDPKRSEFIAKNFLDNPVLVNDVRGVHGYTGTYKGTPVSVMASGMGMPAIGIYSYELFNFFDVDNIIRVGSAGSLQPHIHVRDVVFGQGACFQGGFAQQYHLPGEIAPIADYTLLKTAIAQAEKQGVHYHVGNILSSDMFYNDDPTDTMKWAKMGVMAVEMEAAALYMNAARAGKRGLCICTISDSLVTHEVTTAEERQNTFTQMMEIALDTAVEMAKK
ncbi:MAG: purine-nucleoside phosphorylase [Clostridia bacterium]|nr:purine-nucleoside phosphorylase [Clostridia bacterium]